jgi:hypothetical protein
MKMTQKELKLWRIKHDEYIQSTQWRDLRQAPKPGGIRLHRRLEPFRHYRLESAPIT